MSTQKSLSLSLSALQTHIHTLTLLTHTHNTTLGVRRTFHSSVSLMHNVKVEIVFHSFGE